jgi:hypothetical protein
MELETTAKKKDVLINQCYHNAYTVSRLQLCFTPRTNVIK